MRGDLPEGVGFDEGMFVADDVGGVEGGQDAHFIECVLLFFIGEVIHLHLLEGIDLGVDYPLHLINTRIGSFPQFGHNHEVL
jgi:hypothetical protein